MSLIYLLTQVSYPPMPLSQRQLLLMLPVSPERLKPAVRHHAPHGSVVMAVFEHEALARLL